jgi:hypothetical protein
MTPRPTPNDDGARDSKHTALPSEGRGNSTNELADDPTECSQAAQLARKPCHREELDTYITEMAASAPPLTRRQRDKLAVIFRTRSGALALIFHRG